eukprot:767471-Hanusia_phi.AAC.11
MAAKYKKLKKKIQSGMEDGNASDGTDNHVASQVLTSPALTTSPLLSAFPPPPLLSSFIPSPPSQPLCSTPLLSSPLLPSSLHS